MPSINRRHFIAGASAAGAILATQSWSALGSLAQVATRTFSGTVTIPEGFTVPAGEVWEFDPSVSTTVVVEKNVVVHGTLRMRPSSASVVHTLRFENVDESKFVGGGMEVLETDVGLWVMGFGRLDLQGTPKTAWNRTGWDPSWLPTDEVRIAPIAKGDFGSDGFDLFAPGDPVPSIEIPAIRTWSFTDISSSPFADDIEAIYAAGITTGYPDGRFGPNDGVTRAQMAAFLVRALDLAAAVSADFSDIAGHWAEDAINRLAAAGITTGYPDGRFGPNDGVTRAQMAAFLARALGLESAGSAGFTDVAGHWAEDSINRLAAADITSGYGDGRFGPRDSVTRAQMAAFLSRGLSLHAPVTEHSTLRYTSEIVNLTRNVRVTGTPGARTHVLVRSAVPQQISHVEIRHVGPQVASQGVLGRYGLHFHHCGDASRGSTVTGVVVAEAGFHAFVPHMSHGIEFLNCITYDTEEDAFWWDEPDPSNDIAWKRCVAALVRGSGFLTAGFNLGVGVGSIASECVAVAVQGSKDASGFKWPELANTLPTVWGFTDCVAHNNKVHGIFVWQNNGKNHVIQRFLAFRNGKSGIKHGAYSNGYRYQDTTILQSPYGLIVTAHSNSSSPLEFASFNIQDCEEASIWLGGTTGTSQIPSSFEDFTIVGSAPKLTIASHPDRGARWDVFRRCGIEPEDVQFLSAAPGSSLEVTRTDSSSWHMNGSGTVYS